MTSHLTAFARYMVIIFMWPVLGLLIQPWCHLAAAVIVDGWLLGCVAICTQRRPPAHYESYTEWWADRANWWRKWS